MELLSGKRGAYATEGSNKKNEGWWIGWLVDIPGVNARETKKKLRESLKMGAEDMLNTPFEPSNEEEIVKIEV